MNDISNNYLSYYPFKFFYQHIMKSFSHFPFPHFGQILSEQCQVSSQVQLYVQVVALCKAATTTTALCEVVTPACSASLLRVWASLSWAWICALSSTIRRQLSAYCRLTWCQHHHCLTAAVLISRIADQLDDGGGERHPNEDVDCAHQHVGRLVPTQTWHQVPETWCGGWLRKILSFVWLIAGPMVVMVIKQK